MREFAPEKNPINASVVLSVLDMILLLRATKANTMERTPLAVKDA